MQPLDGFRREILPILHAALRAVDPAQAVRAQVRVEGDVLHAGEEQYPLGEIDRVFVVGGGKGCAPMLAALTELMGEKITNGVVTVKEGHIGPGSQAAGFGSQAPTPPTDVAATGRVRLVEASHPVPDARGLAGVEQMRRLVGEAGERDLVIVLLSGGGSALLPAPAQGITLDDLQRLTGLLLASGAAIQELNTVRKHCSSVAGGQLARLASPARVLTLIISDVVGNPLDAIASGPTVPDPGTFEEALAIVRRYGLTETIPPSVLLRLEEGRQGKWPETPKPGDPCFARVRNLLLADNRAAALAALSEAERRGFRAAYLGSRLEGEAKAVGKMAAGLALSLGLGESSLERPLCLIWGGETTVTLRGKGLGGRNQELALAAALAFRDANAAPAIPVAVVALATDGNDGPTWAAGAIATPETISRGERLGLDALAALEANDSHAYFKALGDLLVTGPTNTNVNDLLFLFAR